MQRRRFITLLGSAAAARLLAPGVGRTQQPAVPVVGFLHSGSLDQNLPRVAAFRKGLAEAGFIDGQNVVIDFRWADGHDDRLAGFAAELVRKQVAVIVTPASLAATMAAKAATRTIPIVFGTGSDPVALGLVASLNRPGGNITGINALNVDLVTKRLGLMRELVPQATNYVALVNPTSVLAEPFIKGLEGGAASFGVKLAILQARTDGDIDTALGSLREPKRSVLLVNSDAFFYLQRVRLTALAARLGLPASYDNRDYVDIGGLVSYGADWLNLFQLSGGYAGRILKGETPAELPVVQPTRYEFVINLKAAKALGLEVPPTVLALADQVIE
jgi:putative ABC transport system substrate-binding protein